MNYKTIFTIIITFCLQTLFCPPLKEAKNNNKSPINILSTMLNNEITTNKEEPTSFLVRRLEYILEEGEFEEPYRCHFHGKFETKEEAEKAIETAELIIMREYSQWYWMMPFPGVKDGEDEMKAELVRVFKEKYNVNISWNKFKWQKDYFQVIGLPSREQITDEYLKTIREVFKINYFELFPQYENSKLYSVSRKPHPLFTIDWMAIGGAPYSTTDKVHPFIYHNIAEAEKAIQDIFIMGDAGNLEEPKIKEIPWEQMYEIVEYPLEMALSHKYNEFTY